MPLQTSGPISMFNICDEFNVPRNTPLMSFYRGGGIVPDSQANSGIPEFGPISLLDFYGASGSYLERQGGPDATFTPPAGSTVTRVGIMVRPNGQYMYAYSYFFPSQGGSPVDVTGSIGSWAVGYPQPNSFGADYEVGFGLVVDSYQTLNQDRVLWVNNNPASPEVMSIRIRERGNTSNYIAWLATVTPT